MDPVSIFELIAAEKLQLVEDLWDDLASNPLDVPILEWQKEELTRRKDNMMKNPGTGVSWEAVKARIKNRHAG